MKTDHCASCRAEVIWAETVSGLAMPVDAAPSPRGNVQLSEPLDPRDSPFAQVFGRGKAPTDVELHLSHFVTCPNAEKHRRAR